MGSLIRSGKLKHQITIERESETVAASGAVSSAWLPVATVRAELVQRDAQEFLTGFGEIEGGSAVFRVRYLGGLTLADRVTHGGVIAEGIDYREIALRHNLHEEIAEMICRHEVLHRRKNGSLSGDA